MTKQTHSFALNLSALLLSLLIISAALEIAASLYYAFRLDGLVTRSYAINSREEALAGLLRSGDKVKGEDRSKWENELIIHPLFGYTLNPEQPGVNNYGFKTSYDFDLCGQSYCLKPYSEDAFVVGFFGGSFAATVAQQGAYLEDKLKKAGVRNPVVINFAIGGHALPQSFFIFQYFRELVDAAVFMDGVNELWNFVENNRAGGPPEYAKVAHFRYKLSLNQLTASNAKKTLWIIFLKDLCRNFGHFTLLPGIRQSLALHGIFDLILKTKTKATHQLMYEIKQSYFKDTPFYSQEDIELVNFAADRWAEYHDLVHDLSAKWGVQDLHFLQANAFVEGGKELTPDEKEIAVSPHVSKMSILNGYPMLRKKLTDLSVKGAVTHDLTDVFSGRSETIWKDPFHPTSFGSKIVLDRVFELLWTDGAQNQESKKHKAGVIPAL